MDGRPDLVPYRLLDLDDVDGDPDVGQTLVRTADGWAPGATPADLNTPGVPPGWLVIGSVINQTLPKVGDLTGGDAPVQFDECAFCDWDGIAYVVSGYCWNRSNPDPQGNLPYLLRFDMVANAWLPAVDMPITASSPSGLAFEAGWAEAINGVVYFGGGDGTESDMGVQTWKYDIASGVFTRLADNPISMDYDLWAAADGMILTANAAGNAAVLNPATEEWTRLADTSARLTDSVRGYQIGRKVLWADVNIMLDLDAADGSGWSPIVSAGVPDLDYPSASNASAGILVGDQIWFGGSSGRTAGWVLDTGLLQYQSAAYQSNGEVGVWTWGGSVFQTTGNALNRLVRTPTPQTVFAESAAAALGRAAHAEGHATASGQDSHAEGQSYAVGNNGHAEGSSRAEGDNAHSEGWATVAAATNSHAEGAWSIALREASHARAASVFGDYRSRSALGSAQYTATCIQVATGDATPGPMKTGSSLYGQPLFTIPADRMVIFRAMIVAFNSADKVGSAWKIEGACRSDGTTVALKGTPTVTLIGQDAAASSWGVAVATATGGLNFNVTGAAGKTIDWSATIETQEVG